MTWSRLSCDSQECFPLWAMAAGFAVQAIGAPPRNPWGPGMPMALPNLVWTAGAGLAVDRYCRGQQFDWDWQAVKSAAAGTVGALSATAVKLTFYGRSVKPLAQAV